MATLQRSAASKSPCAACQRERIQAASEACTGGAATVSASRSRRAVREKPPQSRSSSPAAVAGPARSAAARARAQASRRNGTSRRSGAGRAAWRARRRAGVMRGQAPRTSACTPHAHPMHDPYAKFRAGPLRRGRHAAAPGRTDARGKRGVCPPGCIPLPGSSRFAFRPAPAPRPGRPPPSLITARALSSRHGRRRGGMPFPTGRVPIISRPAGGQDWPGPPGPFPR